MWEPLIHLSPSAADVPAPYLLLPVEASCIGESGAEQH